MLNKRLLLLAIIAIGTAKAEDYLPILKRSAELVERYKKYYAEDKGSKEFRLMLQKRSVKFNAKQLCELRLPEERYTASLKRKPNCALEAIVVYDLALLTSCKNRLKQALKSPENKDGAVQIKNEIIRLKQLKDLVVTRYIAELYQEGKECI